MAEETVEQKKRYPFYYYAEGRDMKNRRFRSSEGFRLQVTAHGQCVRIWEKPYARLTAWTSHV